MITGQAPAISAPARPHLKVVPNVLDADVADEAVAGIVSSRDAVYRRMLAAADLLAGVLGLTIARAVVGPRQPHLAALALAPLIVAMGKVIGLYDREEWLVRKSTLDEAPGLFQLATLYALVVWLINGMLITGTSDRRELLVVWPAVFCALLVFRAGGRWLCRHVTPPERCLVIGDERTCERVRI
jgi:hypothetical protein